MSDQMQQDSTDFDYTRWAISKIEWNNDENQGVIKAHWKVFREINENGIQYFADHKSLITFEPDPTAEDFIPFENLTEEIVLGWVKNAMDTEALEAGLASQIEAQKAPATVTGLPWNNQAV